MDHPEKDNHSKMELGRKPMPGYTTVLMITLVAALAYLAYIFISST
jgi:hypothetical protein